MLRPEGEDRSVAGELRAAEAAEGEPRLRVAERRG